ncbi:formidase [Phaeodactylum tricornutum CCAP 1055/1]|jgi:formamidase|uniref:Formidase n=1 Tax=Phaeodactylum tricornutum (strain CCAP 1055/1) TaxID=556484 RepID=B7FYS6_PHATC|nr:formidase [Phaeodactylum tricornutum CCAP 1055/1]EEC48220.1 formidase [Phaeodactylum tricornutum CCAP 1055/1]|eukprot:XP_002180029.1 formidase [Phaeodactylum tricornutum CCAP 1055/1]
MVKTLISVDPKRLPWEQETPLHNRWHPDIPPVASVEEGEIFRVECVDWTGGQIKNDDSSDDVKNVDLSQVHYLSGPIAIPTAEPGDLLKVELLNLGCLDGDEWGFTGTFAKENGGGFLTEHYPRASKAVWDIEGIYCSSRHIPGVRFAGLIHPGLIGTAPSAELLKMWNVRESALCEEEGTPNEKTLCRCLYTRPLACLPDPKGAMLGQLGHFKAKQGNDETWDKVAAEAARTVPGRENGGNCDIKNLSRGCSVYFPVFVPGANLSMGDMHFSQGDGEVSFCGAIEMSGFLDIKCSVIKGGMEMLPVVGPSPLSVNPIFEIGPLEPRYSEWLVFEGVSVDERGMQHYLDATIAYKRAVLNCIKYLAKFGYTEEQVYLMLSCIPCEGRISGIVDVPNACATLAIPLAIFDRDVRPPKTMAMLEQLANGIKVLNKDVCLSTEGGAEAKDSRLD